MKDIIIWGQNPDKITELFSEISQSCINNRREKTSPNKIKRRKGKKDKDGKQLYWDYVTWGTVTEELDRKYPGWSFEIVKDSLRTEFNHVSIAGRLTVYEKSGLKRAIEAYGCEELIVSNGEVVELMYVKAAETDALKRCAARLGLFNDIYTESDLEEVELSEDTISRFVLELLPKMTDLFAKSNPAVIFRIMLKFHQGIWDIPYIEKTLEEISAKK